MNNYFISPPAPKIKILSALTLAQPTVLPPSPSAESGHAEHQNPAHHASGHRMIPHNTQCEHISSYLQTQALSPPTVD